MQFKYIPANCRLYYKLSNVYNMPNLWHDVANAIWNDQSLCVPGSTGVADTSIEPPPPTNITVIAPSVNFPINSTDLDDSASEEGGIQDAGSTRVPGITLCIPGQCSSACQNIKVLCSKSGSQIKTVSACLPNCKVRVSGCQAQTNCVPIPGGTLQLESKFNGFGKTAQKTTGHTQEIPGLCTPSRVFSATAGSFGCPL